MTPQEFTIEEIIQRFENFDGKYPREHIEAALARQEDITPHLLQILEKVLGNPEKYANDEDYIGQLFAVMLLMHFRETAAHPLIVSLFSLPDDIPYMLFGDTVTEDLALALHRTCAGDVRAIKQMAQNEEANEYCRSAAARALTYAVAENVIPREEIVSFFISFYTSAKPRVYSEFLTLLAPSVYDLYPAESMDVIKQAYEDDMLDPFMIGYDDFERRLKEETEEQAIEKIRQDIKRREPEDFHKSMEWWAMFKQDKPAAPSLVDKFLSQALSSSAPPAAAPPLSLSSSPTPQQRAKKRAADKKAKRRKKAAKKSRKKNRRRR